jgi:AraC-like DNA-binding protein
MIQIIYHNGARAAEWIADEFAGFENAVGNGEIHCYQLLDGVSAMLLRLDMESYTEVRTQVGKLEINFCISGRFETSFSLRDHVLLKPGDMAVSCYDGLHGAQSESYFPLGYYEGICLEIDPAVAKLWADRNAPAFSVDFTLLRQNLLDNTWYMVCPAGPRCEHVFRELYESADYMDMSYLRLKVMELLMLLCRIPRENSTDSYYSAEQAELIHHLRDCLLTDRDAYVSLAKLAEEHEISVSHLQKLFKKIYGIPIYHYIKEYRLERAAVELVKSEKSVTQIAQGAGYDNASKFSECFKKRYGATPSQYRASAKGAAKQSIETRME